MSAEDHGPPTPRVLALEDTTVRHPWDRQVGEGDREWKCFQAYRDMNPRQLSMSGHVGGVRVATAELSRWYNTWHWEDRVNAYDTLTDRIVRQQRERFLRESVEDMSADQLATLSKLRKILSLEMDKYLEAAAAPNGPGLIKPADLKGLLEAEIKMTRLVKGETTEEIGVSGGAKEIDVDELVAWRERLLKPKPDGPPAKN